jgi:Tfp pilus assembly protein PilF
MTPRFRWLLPILIMTWAFFLSVIPPSAFPQDSEKKGVLIIGSTNVQEVLQKLKQLRGEGTIDVSSYKFLFWNPEKVDKRDLEKLSISAGDIPFLGICDLYPDGAPKKVIWKTKVQEPSAAVAAILKEMGVKVSSTAPRTQPEKATASFIEKGNECSDNGDYDGAILNYSKAIEINPGSAAAYYNRGNAYYHNNDYDRTIEDYSKAINLKPDFASAYYGRGYLYGVKKDYDRAIEDHSKAISLKPDDINAYTYRGNAYHAKKEYDRAIEDYSKAITLKPDYADPYYNRANTYYEKKEYDRAIKDHSKAISLKPDFASAYYNRSIVYYFKKDYNNAWADIKKCRDLGKTVNPSFLELLKKASGRNE